MASLAPFFSPSNRGFHPEMSHCLLVAADAYKRAQDMHFEDILGSSSILFQIGKCLPNNHLPVRTWDEIHEELLRIRWRWDQIVVLKKIESSLRDSFHVWDIPEVRFKSLEYQYWSEQSPEDIELMNKEITDYHFMHGFFNDGLGFPEPDHRTAQEICTWVERQMRARRKKKSYGSSKADETSDEDFTQRSRQRFKRQPDDCGSSNKAIVEENSDDDFM